MLLLPYLPRAGLNFCFVIAQRTTHEPNPPSISAQLAGIPVGDTLPVRIMAILNVSPESFYPDSVHTNLEQITETAHALVSEGADIIDIGAMSTAPYLKTDISIAQETERLALAIEAVAGAVSAPISADTKRVQPAQAASVPALGLSTM